MVRWHPLWFWLSIIGFSALFLSVIINAFGVSGPVVAIVALFFCLTVFFLILVPVFNRASRRNGGGIV